MILKYSISDSENPKMFGPSVWGALEHVVENIKCESCRGGGEKFLTFWHDLVNIKKGSPVHNEANFKNVLSFINSTTNKKRIVLLSGASLLSVTTFLIILFNAK